MLLQDSGAGFRTLACLSAGAIDSQSGQICNSSGAFLRAEHLAGRPCLPQHLSHGASMWPGWCAFFFSSCTQMALQSDLVSFNFPLGRKERWWKPRLLEPFLSARCHFRACWIRTFRKQRAQLDKSYAAPHVRAAQGLQRVPGPLWQARVAAEARTKASKPGQTHGQKELSLGEHLQDFFQQAHVLIKGFLKQRLTSAVCQALCTLPCPCPA